MSLRNTRTALTTALVPVALALALLPVAPAHAETTATCAGYIDALPATISTPGTWCLRKDLGTSLQSGYALTIDSNNVTLDCNGFRLGGLAAGDATGAFGVVALNRMNATVRNCSIRGFYFGTYLVGAGHAVLDSRFDQNTHVAVFVQGPGLAVRGNRVLDTGGSTNEALIGAAGALGLWIEGDGDVVGNSVLHTAATPGRGGGATGILHYGVHGTLRDNTVGGLQGDGEGGVRGISGQMQGARVSVRDNHVSAGGWNPVGGTGIYCFSATTVAKGNVVDGLTTGLSGCHDGGDNTAL